MSAVTISESFANTSKAPACDVAYRLKPPETVLPCVTPARATSFALHARANREYDSRSTPMPTPLRGPRNTPRIEQVWAPASCGLLASGGEIVGDGHEVLAGHAHQTWALYIVPEVVVLHLGLGALINREGCPLVVRYHAPHHLNA